MTEIEDESLKDEIDEIMRRVETIMDNVARMIPEDKPEGESGE